MKQAIITGATGFIGSRLVRLLLDNNIEVLAIGRKAWEDVDPLRLQSNKNLTYLSLDMRNINLLANRIKEKKFKVKKSCVFYHFAWGGEKGLSDFNVGAQLNNVAWAVEVIKIAEFIGCKKFIHVGTMEEVFVKNYLNLDYKKNDEYNRHVVFAVAKKHAREIFKSLSVNSKIDLIFTTNSHVMGPNDYRDSFLQQTLVKLISNTKLEFSSGEQIFDVISVSDCAKAYKLIGEKGKKNAEYWIGSGSPRTLKKYIEIMAQLYPSNRHLEFDKIPYNDIKLKLEDFSIEDLQKDTGFVATQLYEDIVHELYDWLLNKKIDSY